MTYETFSLLLRTLLLLAILVHLIPCWIVSRRALGHGPWALLVLIPGVNLVALYWFALNFGRYTPAERRIPGMTGLVRLTGAKE